MKSHPSDPLPLIHDDLMRVPVPTDSFHAGQTSDRVVREKVRHRAYTLWENEGRPENCALAYWLRAEIEVGPGD